MAETNKGQEVVSAFPPPPPYYKLYNSEETALESPPCIIGPFMCFGSILSSEINIPPLDSDTSLYNQENLDLIQELRCLNSLFQENILNLFKKSGQGSIEVSAIKHIVKIHSNMSHILEKLRLIQAYHLIMKQLELQIQEKKELIEQMRQLLTKCNENTISSDII
ncbi:MED7 protein [Cryptosporidium andersoni]|uniref:Mediator of RNA polymerase II transcription subunit 7 n=1 Tax=Cryptosporidium andersoni TaxID=117008 RepID=A0A1J4MAE4_9CRYT|nr:MED7 protein [Cryptosporidium andersoni]